MTIVRARVTLLGLLVCIVAAPWLRPGTASAVTASQVHVALGAASGLGGGFAHGGHGGLMFMQVTLTFDRFGFFDAREADLSAGVDVYNRRDRS